MVVYEKIVGSRNKQVSHVAYGKAVVIFSGPRYIIRVKLYISHKKFWGKKLEKNLNLKKFELKKFELKKI